MKFSFLISVNLDDFDDAVRKYCRDNQYDVPDYTTLIDRIQNDLEQLDGCENVMFDHTSWIQFDFGSDSSRVEKELITIRDEIRQVFANYGVKLPE